MRIGRFALGWAATCLLSGCGDDLSASEGAGDPSTGVQSDAGDTTGEPETTDAADVAQDDSDDDTNPDTGTEDLPPLPARGITVASIEANQAVAVPVFAAGAPVDSIDRVAPLVRERNTLIRAFLELAPDFQPREITTKLTLSYPDGTTEVATQTALFAGDSLAEDFDTTPYFLIPGELIVPDLAFQIELLEVDHALLDTPDPVPFPLFPAEPTLLGIETDPMVLRVTIVPVIHALSDACTMPPDVDASVQAYFSDALYQQNPVQRVELSVREPFAYDAGLSSFIGLLAALADLRTTDGADPQEYYYGVVRPCDGGPDGVGGQAIDIPSFPTMANGWSRTSVGRFTTSLSSTTNTFVHEVGHTQGRYHVACSGQEGGADPSYPYPGGVIGVWGFGVLDFTSHSPTTGKDYMTYCGNTWISDWGWNQVVPFVQEISSWSLEDVAPPPRGETALVGLIDPRHGEDAWFVTTTDASSGRAPAWLHSIEIQAGGASQDLPTTVNAMGDDGAYNVVAPLPAWFRLEDIDSLSHRIGTERRAIGRVLAGASTRQFTD